VAGSNEQEALENCREIERRYGEYPLIVNVVPGGADRCIGVCMVVNRHHEPVVCFCVRRLKLFTYSSGGEFVHPYVLGANVFCESVHDQEAVDVAKRLVREMKYFGMMAMEFRRNLIDDSLTLIKADPRPVRATSLSTALSMDMGLSLYNEFTEKKALVAATYTDGISWIWVSTYLGSIWDNRKNRAILKELLSLITRIRRIKAVANFTARDPLPFLIDLKRWLHTFGKYVLNRIGKRLHQFQRKFAWTKQAEKQF
jgi:predicted ATP-grasp superfamily ATP-dependent carboligase